MNIQNEGGEKTTSNVTSQNKNPVMLHVQQLSTRSPFRYFSPQLATSTNYHVSLT